MALKDKKGMSRFSGLLKWFIPFLEIILFVLDCFFCFGCNCLFFCLDAKETKGQGCT